jgi:hypothetical protein
MAGAVFGLSTFSVRSWTDTYNPGEPGGGRRAAALAADSATLHRLPVRRAFASCGLLQTNIYKTLLQRVKVQPDVCETFGIMLSIQRDKLTECFDSLLPK